MDLKVDKDHNFILDKILNTPDDTEIGYFIEVDLRCPEGIKEKTKYFPFCLEEKALLKTKLLKASIF